MNSAYFFILPCLLLMLAIFGLLGLVLAWIGWRRVKRKSQAKSQTPPFIPPAGVVPPPLPIRVGPWRWFLRCLAAASLVVFIGSTLALWSMKPSVAWAKRPVTQWSDGQAPDLEDLIRKRAIPFIETGNTVGIAVVAATPNRSTIMTFGHPSVWSREATGPDTIFEVGSITKTFTGLALAQAVEKGTVRLDQPIQELLPESVRLSGDLTNVTLRHLTTHTSGLPRMPETADQAAEGLKMVLFGTDPYHVWDEAFLLETLRTVRLESKPGETSSYSNLGVMLLGYLLARRAGCSYEELVTRSICQPLGMADTGVNYRPGQSERKAQGYRVSKRMGPLFIGLRSDPWFLGNDLPGAGGLRSTASDMLKYLQANMRPDASPLAASLKASHEPLLPESGMNWVRTPGQTLKQLVIWHNGGTGGFHSFIGWAERDGVGVAVLCNSSESVDDLASDLVRDLASLQSR